MTKLVKRQIIFKKLREDAVIPTKGSELAAGYDITVLELKNVIGDVEFYHSGIAVQGREICLQEDGDNSIPYYFELFPRSSISKTGYMLANSVGVIDADYTGEIIVPLRKIDSKSPGILANGPIRVAQLIPKLQMKNAIVTVIGNEEEFPFTYQRGDGGFGSTGTK